MYLFGPSFPFFFFLKKEVSSFLFLALVSEFNCFLRSRCSKEMWCPDDIGRDNWDWVGPPAWRGHDSTSQSGVEAPRQLKWSLSRLCCCCCRRRRRCRRRCRCCVLWSCCWASTKSPCQLPRSINCAKARKKAAKHCETPVPSHLGVNSRRPRHPRALDNSQHRGLRKSAESQDSTP